MIGTLKKLFGKKGDPSNPSQLLKGVKNEREALVLLKEARKRDEARMEEANKRLRELAEKEQEHMNEGKKDGIVESKKMHFVRLIKQSRMERDGLVQKTEKIYGPRLKALNTHIASLETVLEVQTEVTPSFDDVENTAIKAKNMMEDLDATFELVNGIQGTNTESVRDAEEDSILEEMNTMAEEDRLKEETKKAEKAEKEIKKEKLKAEAEAKSKVSNVSKVVAKKKQRQAVMEDYAGGDGE